MNSEAYSSSIITANAISSKTIFLLENGRRFFFFCSRHVTEYLCMNSFMPLHLWTGLKLTGPLKLDIDCGEGCLQHCTLQEWNWGEERSLPFVASWKEGYWMQLFRLLVIAKTSLKAENMRHFTALNQCIFTETSNCTVLQRSRGLSPSLLHNHVSIFSLFIDSQNLFL